jgi:phosphatidylserine decarboxylase
MLRRMIEPEPSEEDRPSRDRGAASAGSGGVSAPAPRWTVWSRLLRAGLEIVPRNALSRLAGRFASLRLPGPLQRAEIRLFAWLVGVDLSEAAEPVEAYPTLNRFFTRSLREGARSIATEPEALVSPCDGFWGVAGRVEAGTILQVKGRPYRLADLLGDPAIAMRYEGGCYATLYLSPRDYHRFHTPAAGTIRRLDYWPGSLWPVNSIGLLGVDGLFARNERICAYLELDDPDGEMGTTRAIALVAVGATMVGSVRLSFDRLRTNVPSARCERRELGERAPHFERGEEWGYFEFGSTIILLTPPGSFELEPKPEGSTLRLGERIGHRLAGGST